MTTRQRQRLLRRRRAASTRNTGRGRALVTGSVLGAAALVVPAPAAHAAPGNVPSLLSDIYPGRSGSSAGDMVAIGPRVFFSARDGSHGEELWTSDGTPGGTRLVRDIYPGVGGYVDDLAVMGGTLYFRADDGTNGSGLWKSDGTAAGTTLLAATSSPPQDLTVVGGTLFFSAGDDTRGRELWASDGTTTGTRMVADINPLTREGYGESSDPLSLTAVGGTLFFTASDGTRGRELWASDGTANGTRQLTDRPGSDEYDYALQKLTAVGGTLFFSDSDDIHGRELWTSDGTSDGTRLVVDLHPGTYTYDGEAYANSSSPHDLTDVGGALYFGARDSRGSGLWRSDGTAAGTTKLGAVDPGDLTPVGGTLFFNAWDDDHGRELWTSDGTATGTRMAVDLHQGAFPYTDSDGRSYQYPNSSAPHYLTPVGGTLFFAAEDTARGRELWMSDGTHAGSGVFDLLPGPADGTPSNLIVADGTLFFTANDGVHGRELWAVRPDGSLPPGTPGILPAPPVTPVTPVKPPTPPAPVPPLIPPISPPDTRVVGVTVLGKTKQKQGKKLKITVKARAGETVTTTATGTVTAKGLKGVKLKPAKATSTIGQLGILDLGVSKKLTAKVQVALQRYRRAPKAQQKKLEVKAVVQLVITDAAGNKETPTRTIQLR